LTDIATLINLIKPEADALGFDLVRVQFVSGSEEPTLQIMAERPETGQLGIDDCAALSRRISAKFDVLEEAGRDPIDHAYRLEISSPGIDRPLTRANWAGQEARINLTEAVAGKKQLRGLLLGIADDIIKIDDRETGSQETPLTNVHSAKLILTDALIAATVPVSTLGADEIEEQTLEEQED